MGENPGRSPVYAGGLILCRPIQRPDGLAPAVSDRSEVRVSPRFLSTTLQKQDGETPKLRPLLAAQARDVYNDARAHG